MQPEKCNTSGKKAKPCQKSLGCVEETYFDFNIPSFEVESNLKLQVLYDGGENLQPVLLQRGVSVSWDSDLAHLIWSLKHKGHNIDNCNLWHLSGIDLNSNFS